MPNLRLCLRRALNARGIAATEFALIAPVLILTVLSTCDIGLAMVRTMSLEAAARAGAQYAFYHPQDSSGIVSVVQSNLTNAGNVTIQTPTMTCKCDNGSAVDCTTGSCNGGTLAPIAYVSITLTQPFQFSSPITAQLFPQLATLRGDVEVRLH